MKGKDGEIFPPESDPPPQAPPPPKRMTLDDLKRRRGESEEEFRRRLPPGMRPRWGEGKSDAWKKRLAKARRNVRPPITGKQRERQVEERYAVRTAEREVERQWFAAGIASSKLPLDEKRRLLGIAEREARIAAREELRRKWQREEEERKAREVALPAHITRVRPKPT
jgi:hypothetical protein